MARLTKLVALQPIELDGKPVSVGEPLEVTEAQADALIACGSAETPASAKARAEAKAAEEAAAEAASKPAAD